MRKGISRSGSFTSSLARARPSTHFSLPWASAAFAQELQDFFAMDTRGEMRRQQEMEMRRRNHERAIRRIQRIWDEMEDVDWALRAPTTRTDPFRAMTELMRSTSPIRERFPIMDVDEDSEMIDTEEREFFRDIESPFIKASRRQAEAASGAPSQATEEAPQPTASTTAPAQNTEAENQRRPVSTQYSFSSVTVQEGSSPPVTKETREYRDSTGRLKNWTRRRIGDRELPETAERNLEAEPVVRQRLTEWDDSAVAAFEKDWAETSVAKLERQRTKEQSQDLIADREHAMDDEGGREGAGLASRGETRRTRHSSVQAEKSPPGRGTTLHSYEKRMDEEGGREGSGLASATAGGPTLHSYEKRMDEEGGREGSGLASRGDARQRMKM